MERARPMKHGTKYGYNMGCRCPYCKMAKSIADKKRYFNNDKRKQQLKKKRYDSIEDRKRRGVCVNCGFPRDDFREHLTECSCCAIRKAERKQIRRELIRHAR